MQLKSIQLISVRWWNATAYYAIFLGKMLQQFGCPSPICGREDSPPLQQAKNWGLPTFSKIDLENNNLFNLYQSYRNLKKFISGENITLINAHRPEDHFGAAVLKRRNKKLKLVRTVGDIRKPRDNFINRRLHLDETDHFIFSSYANKNRYLETWQIDENRISVIHAGIDTEYFRSDRINSDFRNRQGIPESAIVFALIGRLSPVKDHSTFIHAAFKVLEKFKNAHFVISGKEVEIKLNELRDIINKSDFRKYFHLTDEVEDVRKIISAIDAGVVSSRGSEGICRIAAEFLSMGKPVIATNVNVLPEMITDGVNGYIFRAEDAQALSLQMKKLIENPVHLKELSGQSRKTAEQFYSSKIFLEKTLAVYNKVSENE